MATRQNKLPKYVMLKDDEWYVRMRFPLGNGKYSAITRRCIPETKDRAEMLAAGILAAYNNKKEQRSIQTLNAHFTRFLAAKKTTVTAKTLSSYTWLYEKHIKDSPLDSLDLSEIKPLHVQDHYSRIPTPKLVKKVHTLLSMCFGQAIRWEIIEKSPCRGLIIPRVAKPSINIMTRDQARAFMAVCIVKYPALALALETGMRPGELLALRWSDIDLEHRTASVTRAVSIDGYKPTKTGKGRIIDLSPSICEMLERLKLEHALFIAKLKRDRKRKKLKTFVEHNLVFATRLGTPIEPHNLSYRDMKQACLDAKIPRFNLYSLRHASLSLLVAAGVNIKSVSERAGHSTAQITLDIYSHAMPSIKSGAVEKLEQALYE